MGEHTRKTKSSAGSQHKASVTDTRLCPVVSPTVIRNSSNMSGEFACLAYFGKRGLSSCERRLCSNFLLSTARQWIWLHYRGRMGKNSCISCAARATWAMLQVPLGISMIMLISDMMHNVTTRKCRCLNKNACGEEERDRFIKQCVWSQLDRQLYKRRQAQN